MKTIKKDLIINGFKYVLIGLSVVGDGKKDNQDSFSFYYDENILIGVVADGLGSAIHSSEGARAACQASIEILKRSTTNFPNELLSTWKEMISGNPLSYDTTLKYVRIDKEGINMGRIGDGWTCSLCNGSVIELKSENTFSNQTDSLMSCGMSDRFELKKVQLGEHFIIVISTDGFSEDINKDDVSSFLKGIQIDIDTDVELFTEKLEDTMNNWPISSNKDDKTVIFIRGLTK